MRLIGGELEAKKISYSLYYTDSGRSSLRLFIRSGNQDKKFLLPNFFCAVVEKVLQDEGVDYEFYDVDENLSAVSKSIEAKEYDVLYLINYFAKQQKLEKLMLEDKIVIEDNVFMMDFANKMNYKKWFGFNSFRKVSALSDGSLVQTNLKIDEKLVEQEEAPFVIFKEDAKAVKYLFLQNNQAPLEQEYLQKFEEAECLLEKQRKIYKMSNKSLYRLTQEIVLQDKRVLKERYLEVCKVLQGNCIDFEADLYFFAPVVLQNRDEVREKLREKGIFLAIHWPESTQKNPLYDTIVSIPLFLHYEEKAFVYMLETIKDALQ